MTCVFEGTAEKLEWEIIETDILSVEYEFHYSLVLYMVIKFQKKKNIAVKLI